MIINIFSLAGHGKSYLAIKKALERAFEKRLLSMSWELDNPHMMRRISAYFEYHKSSYPTNIHLEQMNAFHGVGEFRNMLLKKIEDNDVFILDGVLLLQPNAQEIMKTLEEVSKAYPDKVFVVPSNLARPLNMSEMTDIHMDLRHKFFEMEPKENQE